MIYFNGTNFRGEKFSRIFAVSRFFYEIRENKSSRKIGYWPIREIKSSRKKSPAFFFGKHTYMVAYWLFIWRFLINYMVSRLFNSSPCFLYDLFDLKRLKVEVYVRKILGKDLRIAKLNPREKWVTTKFAKLNPREIKKFREFLNSRKFLPAKICPIKVAMYVVLTDNLKNLYIY